jgi:hypothetical protein
VLTRLDGRPAADTAALRAIAEGLSTESGPYWDVWYGEHTCTFHALNAFTPRIWVWLKERDPEVLRAKIQQVNREWAAEVHMGDAP